MGRIRNMNNPTSSNSASEFTSKHNKNRTNPLSENGGTNGNNVSSSNVREQKSRSTPGNNWYDRGHRRDNKMKERSRERDWSRDRSPHGRGRENGFREEEGRDRFREEQSNFSNYSYNPAADTSFMENNRRALGMMPNLSTYGLFAAMNPSQWGMGQLDGMNMNHNMNPSASMGMHPAIDMNNSTGAGMNPFAFMGMATDPNLFNMMGMGNFSQFGIMNSDANVPMPPPKEIIHLSKSVLYPPNPNAPPPTTREKPPGCKTVFVGGLPENITDEIIKEVFERCGEILTIRMSKKNFCHIRFAIETFVENAIYLSGYRIKIENKDDAPNTGRLHVDYAQARDDQYEYECRQRSLQREARHRERLEQEYYPPTPPPVVHYSDHEATVLGEKLRGEDTFQQAVFTLITWLERGECNKRNAGYFYSMIQSTNSHVRRLMNEKLKYEDELNKAKMMLKQQMQGILLQFTDIGKVFTSASLQKVWDHFTKAQRKNIELWKKQTEEIKNAHVEEVLNDRIEDEMDVSDDEDESSKKTDEDAFGSSENNTVSELQEKNRQLQEENDSLRCQLEASMNEIALVKSEAEQDRNLKELQLQALRQTLQNMQREMLLMQRRLQNEGDHRTFKLKKKDKSEKDAGECSHDKGDDYPDTSADNELARDIFSNSISSTLNNSFNEIEARLIGLISAFLNVHPFGASVDYICSYLHQIDNTTRARDVEALMNKFPTIFKEESTGIGASLEKKWTFCGFHPQP